MLHLQRAPDVVNTYTPSNLIRESFWYCQMPWGQGKIGSQLMLGQESFVCKYLRVAQGCPREGVVRVKIEQCIRKSSLSG